MSWAVAGGVNIQPGVVPVQAFRDVGRHANVVPIGITIASKNVDESLFALHV